MKISNIVSSVLLLLFMVSCQQLKTAEGETVSSINAHQYRDVCCAKKTVKGTFYKTKSCNVSSHESTIGCCEREFLGILRNETLGYFPFACDKAPEENLTTVAICHGPTRFKEGHPVIGGISDSVSGVSNFAHNWIKTSQMEVGMGPKEWEKTESKSSKAAQLSELFEAMRLDKKVTVSWRDHSGYSEVEGSHCDRLYFCDEACVENELKVGTSLGIYSIINQCQSSAVKVLRKCGCFDHCKKWLGNVCVDRVFPPLKGLNLEDEEDQSL